MPNYGRKDKHLTVAHNERERGHKAVLEAVCRDGILEILHRRQFLGLQHGDFLGRHGINLDGRTLSWIVEEGVV